MHYVRLIWSSEEGNILTSWLVFYLKLNLPYYDEQSCLKVNEINQIIRHAWIWVTYYLFLETACYLSNITDDIFFYTLDLGFQGTLTSWEPLVRSVIFFGFLYVSKWCPFQISVQANDNTDYTIFDSDEYVRQLFVLRFFMNSTRSLYFFLGNALIWWVIATSTSREFHWLLTSYRTCKWW